MKNVFLAMGLTLAVACTAPRNQVLVRTADGGAVRVQLHQREDRVLITVEDEGPGISEEDRSRIFEKFYQADRSRSGSGNGLGLALVRRIVTLHGGDVTVESEPGRGALFTVDKRATGSTYFT